MTDEKPKAIRRTVYFAGSVQGVGFRYTTEAIASHFAVSGFVRNLRDGRVELVAEGAKDDVDRFHEAVAEAMRSNISKVSATDGAATGEFQSFGIAF